MVDKASIIPRYFRCEEEVVCAPCNANRVFTTQNGLNKKTKIIPASTPEVN
jgi:hypothetical protein